MDFVGYKYKGSHDVWGGGPSVKVHREVSRGWAGRLVIDSGKLVTVNRALTELQALCRELSRDVFFTTI